jgi:tRNA G18 (ribose-2'-O)-methylase SpoU
MESLTELKKSGFQLYGVEQTDHSVVLSDFSPPAGAGIALVFGNEVQGIDDNILNELITCIEIPQSGTKHSLNVSVAAGIILWDIYSKMKQLPNP